MAKKGQKVELVVLLQSAWFLKVMDLVVLEGGHSLPRWLSDAVVVTIQLRCAMSWIHQTTANSRATVSRRCAGH